MMQSIIPGTKTPVLVSLLLSTYNPSMYNPLSIRSRTQEVETDPTQNMHGNKTQ